MSTQSNEPKPVHDGTQLKTPATEQNKERHPSTVTSHQTPQRTDSTKPDAQPRSDAPKPPDLDKSDPRRLEVEAGKSAGSRPRGTNAS